MKGKILFVAGAALGYVLGARAGRSAYVKIKSQAESLWENPSVQKTVHQAEDFVKENAPAVGKKLQSAAGDAASAAGSKAKSVASKSDKKGSGSSSSSSGTGAESEATTKLPGVNVGE
jgi:hypothetical protein